MAAHLTLTEISKHKHFHPYIDPAINKPISFIYLPIYLFAYLPIYLFTYLSIYLFTYLSMTFLLTYLPT